MVEKESFTRREFILTADGSSSIYLPDLDETYHNRRGAVLESEYIYIERGLRAFEKSGLIKIVEVGFGTGLNALLTLMHFDGRADRIEYTTLEPYPLLEREWRNLNYHEWPGLDLELFTKLHSCPWNESVELAPGFSITKIDKRLEDWEPTISNIQLVYFDAFAPNKQGDIWSGQNFRKLHALLIPTGQLVTYCAQGEFKRTLLENGFKTTHPPGPLGKKEMTIAVKA